MDYDDETLIRDLKALMKQKKRSARSISQSINVPYRSIQNYLSGESRMPAIVLLKILENLGATIRMLRHNDNLLSHPDLYDAIHHVFGDFVKEIDLARIGRRSSFIPPAHATPEELEAHSRRLEVASELAARLSEAYDEFSRSHQAPGHFPTIKEMRQRAEARSTRPRSGSADKVGQ